MKKSLPSLAGLSIAEQKLIIDCLRFKLTAPKGDIDLYLRGKGVAESAIPGIIALADRVEQERRTARSRMQEGRVVTALGVGGVVYASVAEKDGAVWLFWSMVGLGILANGWWKKKKIKQYY